MDRLTSEPNERWFVVLNEADQFHDRVIIYYLTEPLGLMLPLFASNEDNLSATEPMVLSPSMIIHNVD